MGAFKDIVDLTENLLNRVKNREYANDVKEILSLIMEVQRDQIETEDRNRKLAEENAQLKRRNAELETVKKISPTWGREDEVRIAEEEERILLCLDERENQTTSQLSQDIDVSESKTKYFLYKLSSDGFIYSPMIPGEASRYRLDEKGRKYLFENDLLD